MAVDNTYVLVGAGTVEIGAYVTAGGTQTTMVDIGHTKSPVTITGAVESFKVTTERAFAAIKEVMTGMECTIKVPAMEVRGDILRYAFNQPSTNLSGTSPDATLLIGTPSEQYFQVRITGPGKSDPMVCTFWRCSVKIDGEWPMAKGDSAVVPLTLTALFDSSVSTADKIGKIAKL